MRSKGQGQGHDQTRDTQKRRTHMHQWLTIGLSSFSVEYFKYGLLLNSACVFMLIYGIM